MSESSENRKIVSFRDACEIVREAKREGKRAAFTSGCFDILHAGHVVFLQDCKKAADLLMVGVDDDETVKAAKGDEHPFFHETERMTVLAAMTDVDYVFPFRGPCSTDLLAELKPDSYCFSPYDPKHACKTADAKNAGVEPKEFGYSLKAWSSSKVGRAIRFGYLLESWSRKRGSI